MNHLALAALGLIGQTMLTHMPYGKEGSGNHMGVALM